MQTESNDFKLVFISSGDSSKDSDQLNSSLENAGAADTSLPSANGEFIGDMEYEDELTVTNGSNSGSNHNTVSSISNNSIFSKIVLLFTIDEKSCALTFFFKPCWITNSFQKKLDFVYEIILQM